MAFDKQSEIKHPLARSERLVIQNIGDETVVYDEDAKTAHALKPLAATVFMYADGNNSTAEIAELASYRLRRTVTEADVKQAVTELDECSLLQVPETFLEKGISRRTALKTLAAAGAGTMLITSVAAPFAMAQSNTYTCPTGDGSMSGADGQEWPQPWAPMGTLRYSGGVLTTNGTTWTEAAVDTLGGPVTSGSYTLGDSCWVTTPTQESACWYDGSAIPTSDIPDTTAGDKQCTTTGFYVTTAGTWDANWTGSGTAPTNACVYDNTVISTSDVKTSTQCQTTGFCWHGGNYSSNSKSKCTGNGYQWVTGSWDSFTTGAWKTNWVGTEGIYQCVPCDLSDTASYGYQCCEVVCASELVTGSVHSTYSITATEGYGPYNKSACEVWGTSGYGQDFCTTYPGKWCQECTGANCVS